MVRRKKNFVLAVAIALVVVGAAGVVVVITYEGSPVVVPTTTSRPNSTTSFQATTTNSTSSSLSTYSFSSSSSATNSGNVSKKLPIKHVVLILDENEEYTTVINCACAPYEKALIKNYSLAGNYFSVEHPSLPNYLDLTAGSDLGITSDCTPPSSCPVSNSTNIVNLLDRAGLSWKSYEESMPTPCFLQNSGLYATKHNPFAYYPSITSNSTYCASHIVPMNISSGEGLFDDLASNNLPAYSFVTPNLCNDGHNCGISAADKWLSLVVSRIIASAEFNSTAVFIVYDEGTGSGFKSSQVVCILVSPFAKTDYVSHIRYTHFSLLATVEGLLNLGNLGRNDSSAAVMSDMFYA